MAKPLRLTPMLEQYFEIKQQVPDTLLLYRLGDFYELFFEDALLAAPLLDLVLTARGKGSDSEAPMCGIPYHAADQYIAKLVRGGHRVAICEQTSDPAASKGLVDREIVRIVTPGTAIEGSIVERENCYVLSLAPGPDGLGAAWLDVSTGDFFVTRYDKEDETRLLDDLMRHGAREAVLTHSNIAVWSQRLQTHGVTSSPVEESYFEKSGAVDLLTRHFGTQSLRGFGLDDSDTRVAAAAAVLRYATSTRRRELGHVSSLRVETEGETLILDASTLENLEVFESRDSSRPRASLWSVVDKARTAMGARMLHRWLARPLRDKAQIFERHDAVDELTRSTVVLETLTKELGSVSDLERLTSRISLGSASPRECLALSDSLSAIGGVRSAITAMQGPRLVQLRGQLDPLEDVTTRITTSLADEPPPTLKDGGVIRAGVDDELDSLRAIASDSKSILLEIESEERSRTSISSLKVRFNNVFGYYIEVSNANLSKVPADYIRKQTLVNAERFITPRLKEIEEKILGAESRSIAIELELYEKLLRDVAARAVAILKTAAAVGETDALATFANVASRNRWTRAVLSDDVEIEIEQGRHPVIEAISTERFIPNDTSARRGVNEIQLITGPNMGGKSTYLRQIAQIVLLNQAGSFVPAAKARLGIFDRIFTRVGASDHLARGESTFLVEMHETANILNNATNRSLIVLDEVGRGTATFDGLSLAWAIIEFLHDDEKRNAITFFATHYHEVTDLAKTRTRVANFSVAVREWNDQIVFLRRVVPGAADKSYGIHVAKLAGVPGSVTDRAREILATLERKEKAVVEETSGRRIDKTEDQLSLFATSEELVARSIRGIDTDSITPIEALNLIHQLKKRLTE